MSIVKYSEISNEEERINSEIAEYKRLIDKVKKRNLELSKKESKIFSKTVCLSSLPSPKNTRNIQLSKEDMNSKCKKCADLLLQYGRERL